MEYNRHKNPRWEARAMYLHKDVPKEKEWLITRKTGCFTDHELHNHYKLEIHVLRDNEAIFKLADKQIEGKPGDVVLFRPFELHFNLAKDKEKPIEWISIVFIPSLVRLIPNGYNLLAPFYNVASVSPYIPRDQLCAEEVQRLAELAVIEEQEQCPGWESKQFAYLVEIIACLFRHYMDNGSIHNQSEGQESVVKAIAYLLDHYTDTVGVDQLFQIAGRKRTYFYKAFKEITSVTPNEFIHRLRMQMALQLLSSSSRSIIDIALDCGYQSIHTFNKKFHEFQDMSPREYRKRQSIKPKTLL
jgi:AraC-like DNA-binding protein